ncbi:hypothetical protein COY23_02680 [bacterium (Candidatus Torokbacteria) CG_4_10_14_0_2_um_filter_35_8]|nr:MAG: hypothetical protein COY23_02680 [bacterium (Candidatus Torokbacteria) CG_4_10_14_0_2_um_filter_35_8]
MNQILKTIKPVIKKSQYVKINPEKIRELCKDFKLEDMQRWMESSPTRLLNLHSKKKLNFLFVFNSINFCYWGEPKWTIKYQGKEYDGVWGMICALKRAIDYSKPILDFNYLSNITKKELEEILKGNIKIPLFQKRLEILREVGKTMTQKYKGDFKNIINSSKNDALKLLKIITTDFPSFNDYSIYDNKKVCFHKRAQLLISDIYRTFKGKSYGKLKNVENLTAFADYKIPQTLRKLGILGYSQDLAEKIDNKILIPKDSKEEIEIRANMIWAIELIKNKLKTKIPKISSMDIDSYLWLMGQKKSPDDKPYHKTLTIAY